MTIFAMVFPGQGSHAVGMLSELSSYSAIVQDTFAEASSVLGYNLWRLIQEGPIEELSKTWITQPALLASSVSIWRLWQQKGRQVPLFMAGHSLGEYSALVCAGSIEFSAAINLVALRGKLMQDAVPVDIGAMSAIINLDKSTIAAICKKVSGDQVVEPVNFNSPNQVVISGHKEAVERASWACKKAGAKRVLPISVSVPSHCSLMKPAAEKLSKALESVIFTTPKITVINNVDVRAEQNPIAIRHALVRQLYSPVRWSEIVEYFVSEGVELLLEAGPGNVLTGLTKHIVSTLSSMSLHDPASLSIAIK